MNLSKLIVMAAGLGAVSGSAVAQPDHIYLSEEDGALRTDLWVDNDPNQGGPPNEEGGDITPNVRAFSIQMGGIPGFGPQDPGQTIHPGLFGSFPDGVSIGFNLIDGLRVWDRQDFDAVSGDDAGEVRVEVSGFTTPAGDDPLDPETYLTPPQAGGFVAGDAAWLTGSATDPITEHLQFTLTDAGGTPLTESEADAVSGIFLVTLEFTSPTLEDTAPMFLTLGQNVSDGELAAAQGYVEDVLVPAPPAAGALAALGLLAGRRRRVSG